jgi:hypothetical protein
MPPPCLTPEEFEATREACAITLAKRELVSAWREDMSAWREDMLETIAVTRAAIEDSRDLMVWADVLLNRRV